MSDLALEKKITRPDRRNIGYLLQGLAVGITVGNVLSVTRNIGLISIVMMAFLFIGGYLIRGSFRKQS